MEEEPTLTAELWGTSAIKMQITSLTSTGYLTIRSIGLDKSLYYLIESPDCQSFVL